MARANLHKNFFSVLLTVAAIASVVLVPLTNIHAATSCYAQTWKQGSSGQCVKDIQNLLNYDLYKTNSSQYLVLDGSYGSYTTAAVKQEQKNSGITVNGSVNAQTWPYVCTSGTGTVPSWYTSAAQNAGCPSTTGSAPVSYTLNNLSATVSGTSVTATATVAASVDTTAQYAGICVRDVSGTNFDFSKAQNIVLTTTGTVLSGPAQTLAVGTYSYYACVDVQNVWTQVGKSQTFTTTSGSGTGSGSTTVPYAAALSGYGTLAQSYTASDMISGNWSQNANDTQEGGGTCPTTNTSYDVTNDAVMLSTNGTAENPGSNTDCGHIRSTSTVPTNGAVIESKVWLPSNSSGQLINWASFWTDGVGMPWPQAGELDAIETQYGVNYSSVHYGTNNTTMSTTPSGWGALPAPVNNAANDAVAGWNTVDMEFLPNWAGANVYINGNLYASFPASAIPHYPAYVNWGISGPNLGDPNHASWPSGPGYEEIQSLKVFTQ